MFELIPLIKAAGYLGLFAIVFAESGLLIGFFLPGDSLLFTAGFLASKDFLDIRWLLPTLFIAAVTGDSVGYAFGRRVGPKIFKREDSIFFHKNHLKRAVDFFNTHGGRTIIIARFIPVVRTFAPILAGVGHMNYRKFLIYNITGGSLWAMGLTLLGYFLGKTIPNIDHYLLPIIAVIIILSILPSLIHIFKDKQRRNNVFLLVKKFFFRLK